MNANERIRTRDTEPRAVATGQTFNSRHKALSRRVECLSGRYRSRFCILPPHQTIWNFPVTSREIDDERATD
jgi:hypothetical protein